MYPTQHAAATAVAAVPLRARGWSWRDLFLFWCGGVLIDADHYLSYVWKYHDLSLRRAYRFHRGRVPRGGAWGFRPRLPQIWPGGHRPFHAVTVIALLFVLARRFPLLRPVAWGMLFHRVQDSAWEAVTRADDDGGPIEHS